MLQDKITLERWMPIPGFESSYIVSNLGRIKSLARIVIGKKKQTVGNRLLSQMSNGNGYQTVRLWCGNKEKSLYVHRLVLIAFIGPAPEGMESCHNDGDRSNNVLSNLRWDTKINNHADKFKHGTIRNGEKARASKLTEEKVLKIRERLNSGEDQESIAIAFGIKQPSVSDIKNRRTWKHI